jgi:hypothetical protein
MRRVKVNATQQAHFLGYLLQIGGARADRVSNIGLRGPKRAPDKMAITG